MIEPKSREVLAKFAVQKRTIRPLWVNTRKTEKNLVQLQAAG